MKSRSSDHRSSKADKRHGSSSKSASDKPSSKSSSSKPSNGNSGSGRPSRASVAESSSSRSVGTVSRTFLFVVNEINVAYRELDSWQNSRPPSNNVQGYEGEVVSHVMKYTDGIVSDVDIDYYFARDNEGVGAIYYRGDKETAPFDTETYKASTVMSCHPFMPIAMVDVDATVIPVAIEINGQDAFWEPLQFRAPSQGHLVGVSQAIFTRSLQQGWSANRHVTGLRPRWMPSLVPPIYKNRGHAGPSLGLSGELTILLALMVFFRARDPNMDVAHHGGHQAMHGINAPQARANWVFPGRSACWVNHRWLGEGPPNGYVESTESLPEGVIVYVAFDPFNPQGSNGLWLQNLEFNHILVEDMSP